MPALECFPADAFRRSSIACLSARGAWSGGTGHRRTYRRCAKRSRAVSAGSRENMLVLAGAQQGLDLLARCLIDPGDTVVVDRPGYLGAITRSAPPARGSSAGTSPVTISTSSKI